MSRQLAENQDFPRVKPLHVKVAEALGWRNCRPGGIMLPGAYVGNAPGIIGEKEQVPWFDQDWSATGPLIEKYKLFLSPSEFDDAELPWFAGTRRCHREAAKEECVYGNTALKAVCLLILKLQQIGRLG